MLILLGAGCSVEKESIESAPDGTASSVDAAGSAEEGGNPAAGERTASSPDDGRAAGNLPAFQPSPSFTPHWSAPNLAALFRRRAGERREVPPYDDAGADALPAQPPPPPPRRTAPLPPAPARKTLKIVPKDFHLMEPYLKGIASWYGPNFHGKETANGETYNQYGMTAAHPTLPKNTLIRVRNLRNNQVVLVRVNDRGPYKKGRILDLSKGAAKRLKMIAEGTAPVRITVMRWPRKVHEDPALLPYIQYVVQVAAYPEPDKAESELEEMQRRFPWAEFQLDYRPSGLLSVVVGPFSERASAQRVSRRLNRAGVTSLLRRYRK